jgi:signal transduction histidine kinase
MSLRFRPTPFSESEWARRYDLFDSISTWALGMSIAIAVLYTLVLIFGYSLQFLVLFLGTVLLIAACLVARVLARRGYLDLAVYVLMTVMLLVMSGAALMLEGIVLMVAAYYVAVIAMSGILLGTGASFGVAALAGVLYVVVSILSRQPFIVPLALGEDATLALMSFIAVLTFLFIAHLGRLTTRDLRQALRDATYELVKANEELQEANRLKTQFLARVSHELRSPLNAIIGYTDMNLAGYYGKLNEAQQDGLERVQRNSRQLLALINDVLDLSRIEAGRMELQQDVVDPRALVHSVVATVEPRAREKKLRLSYEVAPDLPRALIGDEVRLNQVLLNLVDNAVKFTSRGSVHVWAQVGTGDSWTLQVRDTGRGISEREVAHIFDEFRQGEAARGRELGGTGLGLAIVRRLVEAMGGSINVKSRLEVGSTFTVSLPLQVAGQSVEEKEGARP